MFIYNQYSIYIPAALGVCKISAFSRISAVSSKRRSFLLPSVFCSESIKSLFSSNRKLVHDNDWCNLSKSNFFRDDHLGFSCCLFVTPFPPCCCMPLHARAFCQPPPVDILALNGRTDMFGMALSGIWCEECGAIRSGWFKSWFVKEMWY